MLEFGITTQNPVKKVLMPFAPSEKTILCLEYAFDATCCGALVMQGVGCVWDGYPLTNLGAGHKRLGSSSNLTETSSRDRAEPRR
jgi:hypothetical protein